MKKLILFVLIILLLSSTVYGDIGPKPTLTIIFQGNSKDFIVTALSKEKSTGPFGVEDGYNNDMYLPFQTFQDADGYYFIEEFSEAIDTKEKNHELYAGYYPPRDFKLLMYRKDIDTYAISEVLKAKYFNSKFTIDCKKIDWKTRGSGNTVIIPKDGIKFENNMNSLTFFDISPYLLRLIMTILVEGVIAVFLFNIKELEKLKVIAIANLLTQSCLTLCLYLAYLYFGSLLVFLLFFILEFIIFLVEGSIYKKRNITPKPYLYAFIANLCTLGLTYVISIQDILLFG
ncbi:MAG: hypothetical protein Q4Q07_02490 [Tissierellia bacterium]|nr:hypothetical protein [Tissierellia bacterium]